jgi:hypothetical protein
MGQVQDDDMRELIAGALEGGASLLVRYLARGTSLTWRTALATLDADGSDPVDDRTGSASRR